MPPEPPDSLSDLVDFIVDTNQSLPSFRRDGVHPSEISDSPFCPRKEVFKGLNKQHKLGAIRHSVRLRKIFDIGHALHDQWRQQYLGPGKLLYGIWRCSRCHETVEGFMPDRPCTCVLSKKLVAKPDKLGNCVKYCALKKHYKGHILSEKKMKERGGCTHCGLWGKWEYQEYSIEITSENDPNYPVVGHVDGIIVRNPGTSSQLKTVLDIKTIGQDSISFLFKPKKNHIYQLHLYMQALGINKAELLYVNKTDGSMKSFIFEYDENIIKEINQRIIRQIAAEGDIELIPMADECSPSSKMRMYCPFSDICPSMKSKQDFIDHYKGEANDQLQQSIEKARDNKEIRLRESTEKRQRSARKRTNREISEGSSFGKLYRARDSQTKD